MINAVYVHKEYCIEELRNMFRNAVLAFDTNVLLGLYQYSPKALADIKGLLTLEGVKPRLFIPYHTAEEYYKHKDRIIKKAETTYLDKIGRVTTAINSLEQDVSKSHFLYDWIIAAKTTLNNNITALQDEYTRLGINMNSVSDIIEEIFSDEAVGPELHDKELYEELYERRAKYDIPPGITDRQKKQNQSGDFIIWSELLQKAKTDHTDIIFITNEKKFDWWDANSKGRPNPKLLIEFNKKTGQRCYFFNMDKFINFLARNLDYRLDHIEMPTEDNEQDLIMRPTETIEDNTVAQQVLSINQAG